MRTFCAESAFVGAFCAVALLTVLTAIAASVLRCN